MNEANRTVDPSLDLLPDLRAQMAAEDRGWRRLRSWSTPLRHGTAMALLLALELLVLVATPRLDMNAYPVLRLVAALTVLIGAASLGLRRFLHPRFVRAPRLTRVATTATLLLLVPVAFALLPGPHAAVHLHPESFEGTGADFVPRALACLVFGTLVALPTMLFLFAANRTPRLDPVRVALAAGAGGLAGTIGLLLHCPLVSVSHRLAGHGGVGLAAAGVLAIAAVLVNRRRKISGTA